ncbi:hypothetical protein ACONJS_004551 [Vibrio parahaemolyticus]|uniref:hypothetical protein n=1 Tax=Shewanella chilikensis TaxID=558541 RepID=UPI00399C1CDE
MSFKIEGNDCMPSISGGYLLVTIDGEEISTIGVPSPILADKHRDSVNENYDDFEDSEGNQYEVMVWSSNVGVDWEVTVKAAQGIDENILEERVEVEYQANDF